MLTAMARTKFSPRRLLVPLPAIALLLVLVAGCGDESPAGDSGGSEPQAARERPPPPAPVQIPDNQPNVVFVISDDQRADSLRFMPHVRRELATRGTDFTQAIATTPQCCPSRATFLTGRYAHNHRVRANAAPLGGYTRLRGDRILPVWLQRAGYRTAHIGRYLNEYGNPNKGTDPLEVPPGWDEWQAPVRHTEFGNYDYTLNENGTLVDYGSAPEDYSTDVYADKARDFVAEAAPHRKPFYLSVATHAPHLEGIVARDAPRNPRPAPRDLGRFESDPLPRGGAFNEADLGDKPARVQRQPRLSADEIAALARARRSRLESLLAIDRLVGGLIKELRQSGELDNTIFVYTSDHGYLLGEHRLTGKNEVYEPSLRIPLVIRGPGLESGMTENTLVGNIDVVPTITAATGATPDYMLDGLPLQAQDRQAVRERAGLAVEHFERPRFRGVRTENWLYAETVPGSVELYDLRQDPDELENLAGDRALAEREELLRSLSRRLATCIGRVCAAPE